MKRKLMIMLTLVLALSVTACSKDDDNVAEEDTTPPVENTDKPEVDVDDEKEPEDTPEVTDGQAGDWPADFMPTAPVLDESPVVVKDEGPNKMFLEFRDMDYDEASSYVVSMKAAGFTENTNENLDENNINYKGMDAAKNLLIFHWDKSGIAKLEMIKTSN